MDQASGLTDVWTQPDVQTAPRGTHTLHKETNRVGMDDKKTNRAGEDYDTEAPVKRLNIITVYLVSQWRPGAGGREVQAVDY